MEYMHGRGAAVHVFHSSGAGATAVPEKLKEPRASQRPVPACRTASSSLCRRWPC
jgi:hypothetical protein